MRKLLVALLLVATVLSLSVVPVLADDGDDSVVVLTATIVPRPVSNGGGGGGFSPEYTASAPSVSATIPSGTIVRNASGNIIPAYYVSVTPAVSPPPPPSNRNIVGLSYDFQPAGATFSPPITLTLNLPEGLPTTGLVLAFYDTSSGTWVELPSTIVGNTITAQVSHFTVFAVLTATPVALPPVFMPPVTPEPPKEPDAVVVIPPITPPSPDPVVTATPDVPIQPDGTDGVSAWWYLLIVVPLGVLLFGVLRIRRKRA